MLTLLLALLMPAPPTGVEVVRRYHGVNASQGVAVDERSFYGVSNSAIDRFDKRTGARIAQWKGDPARYPHLNACVVITRELVCAGSNYPSLPMRSRVEVFDPDTLTPKRTITLDKAPGSITWIDRHDGHWWAGFANYDGRGGQPGRDHSFTALVEYDDAWRPVAQWSFPKSVLDRMAPYSTSGGGFGDDGLIYATGHDLPEIYGLRAPKGGGQLELVATLPMAVNGQAVAWDHGQDRVLYGISRATGDVVVMRVAQITTSNAPIIPAKAGSPVKSIP
jgi:hypothetical protein